MVLNFELGIRDLVPFQFSLKSPRLYPVFGASFFHPLSLLWVRSPKRGKFIKSGYEMLKLSIWWTMLQSHYYSSPTSRSSENICSSSGSAQEKGKRGQNRMKLSLPKKNCWNFQKIVFSRKLFCEGKLIIFWDIWEYSSCWNENFKIK